MRVCGRLEDKRFKFQGVLYSDFVKGELQRLLARSKARVDASSESGFHDERVRHRNWLSSINNDSGAWLLAGTYYKLILTLQTFSLEQESLEDLGRNTDFYVFNDEVVLN